MTRISHSWVAANLETRITAHVHAWEKTKGAKEPLTPETFPFVTISRQFGCEAVPLALRLGEILNERCRPFFTWLAYDRELLDKVAQELKLHRNVVETIDGHRRSEMSELFDAILNPKISDTVMFRKLAEVVRSLAIRGHTILVGRGSYLITQDLKTGMHIRLTAPRAWRVQRLAHDYELTTHQAAKKVDELTQQRDRFIGTFFAHDPEHPFHHDLILDNSRFNLAQLAEIVFTALGARFGERLVGA